MDESLNHGASELINPYQTAPDASDDHRPAWGRLGAAAGALAVAVAPLHAASSIHPPSDTLWFITGVAATDAPGQSSAKSPSAGYLWPAPPSPLASSPALGA